MKRETMQRIPTPTAILVGLSDALAEVCIEVLGDGGLRVLRAAHVAAAAERIPVVMPQIVLVASSTTHDELEMLNDRCVAVGAKVISVGPQTDPTEMVAILRDASNVAFIKALRSS